MTIIPATEAARDPCSEGVLELLKNDGGFWPCTDGGLDPCLDPCTDGGRDPCAGRATVTEGGRDPFR